MECVVRNNLNGGGASGRDGRVFGAAALYNGQSDDMRKQYNNSSTCDQVILISDVRIFDDVYPTY